MNKNSSERVDDIIGRINNSDDLIFDTDFDCDIDCDTDCDCDIDYDDNCSSKKCSRHGQKSYSDLIDEYESNDSNGCYEGESESPCEDEYEDCEEYDECEETDNDSSFCEGMEEGYSQGYDEGLFKCKKNRCAHSYQKGYCEGRRCGYEEGFEDGYEKAKQEVLCYIKERNKKKCCCCCCCNNCNN